MRSMKLLAAMAVVTVMVAGPVLAADEAMEGATAPAPAPAMEAGKMEEGKAMKKHHKHHKHRKHHGKRHLKKEHMKKSESAPAIESVEPIDSVMTPAE